MMDALLNVHGHNRHSAMDIYGAGLSICDMYICMLGTVTIKRQMGYLAMHAKTASQP